MNQTKIQLKIYKVRLKPLNNNNRNKINRTLITIRIKNKHKNIGNMAITGTKPHEGSKEPI